MFWNIFFGRGCCNNRCNERRYSENERYEHRFDNLEDENDMRERRLWNDWDEDDRYGRRRCCNRCNRHHRY